MTEMNKRLFDLVVARLDADPDASEDTSRAVRAACSGQVALAECLAHPDVEVAPPTSERSAERAPGMFLKRLSVGGFRGIGPTAKLEFAPGPGLTVVAGRNGSGKSSFAEAFEILLYGKLGRWKDMAREWKQGWANIHTTEESVWVEAELTVEGSADPLIVRREWAASKKKVKKSTVSVRWGERSGDMGLFPGREQLDLYRPVLSHRDLGRQLEGRPADLYDQVSGILGLDGLADARYALQQVRIRRAKRRDAVVAGAGGLRRELSETEDERARECLRALDEEPWNLDAILDVVEGRGESAELLSQLRRLAALEVPTEDHVQELTAELQGALDEEMRHARTDAGRNQRMAELLGKAVSFHEAVGDVEECPVCLSDVRLDSDWRQQAEARITEAREAAVAARHAADRVRRAFEGLQSELAFLGNDDVQVAKHHGLGPASAEACSAWAAAETDDPQAMLTAVSRWASELLAAGREIVSLAKSELGRRAEAWSALVDGLRAWLPVARASLQEDDAGAVKQCKDAEDWILAAGNDIRAERFEPIASEACQYWEEMRENSNVSLSGISLSAKGGTHRRVDLEADVDGTGGTHSALSLMSQGELNVLALSLFLPRVTLDETPFHFVLLDDPVQSMDPHKVDGLARVLHRVSRTRQVIVFTHDPRLLEALDRLMIESENRLVTRKPGSIVEVTPGATGSEHFLRQADRMLEPGHAEAIGEEKLRRLVPGICKLAVEAALQRAARRRLLASGMAHRETEERLGKARAMVALASLALFGDVRSGGDVKAELERRDERMVRVHDAVTAGAHGAFDGDLKKLVKETRKIAPLLEALS